MCDTVKVGNYMKKKKSWIPSSYFYSKRNSRYIKTLNT